MKGWSGVAGESTARRMPLSTGWKSKPQDEERNRNRKRGESLHANIVRLFVSVFPRRHKFRWPACFPRPAWHNPACYHQGRPRAAIALEHSL